MARSNKSISVLQQKYVIDFITETGMLGYKSSDTPIDAKRKIDNMGESVEKDRYQ